MTQIIDVKSWQDFESKLTDLQERQRSDKGLQPRLLFRGQANSEWKLETTLERSGKKGLSFGEYYRLISFLKPEIEAFTENLWDIPSYYQIVEQVQKYDFTHAYEELRTSIYGYMAHVRHHGFPSPLLDWTRSPYVAAYFALLQASEIGTASIYALSEANIHSGGSGQPDIITFGPYVKTHRRHFLQQCEYTMGLLYTESRWQFSEHERGFEDRRDGEKYPINSAIYKFNIPGAERLKVLKMLDGYNLNAFSLFGSEESLMETLALRHLHFSEF